MGDAIAFDWDDSNVRHLARHGVTPDEVEQFYRHDPLIVEEQLVNGEERYLALGETDAGQRLALVFTIRRFRVRFVTAYPMTREQQEIYEEG